MQAGSGGHNGRVEKQIGLNLQVGGGRLKQGSRSVNVEWISLLGAKFRVLEEYSLSFHS